MRIHSVVSLFCFFVCNIFLSDVICAEENGLLSDEEIRKLFGYSEDFALEDYGIAEVTMPKTRSKRGVNRIWHFSVTLQNGTVIDLNLKSTGGILANENTPIWTATGTSYDDDDVTYTQDTEFMIYLGEFGMFHDYANKAAITVFPDTDQIQGVVGYYEIQDSVPASFNRKYIFLKKPKPSNPSSAIPRPLDFSNELRPNGKPDIVYPELLIVLDIEYIQQDDYAAIQEVIAYWNKVDMLYSGLQSPQVKLNIAGIIVSQNQYTTPWLKKANVQNYNRTNSTAAIKLLPAHFAKHTNEFPDDSYDFLVSFNPGPLWFSKKYPSMLGYASWDGHCGRTEKPAIIVDHIHSIYTTAAHELGHLLSAEHDQIVDKCKDRNGIMATNRVNNEAALTWSQCSLKYFSNYFSRKISICLDNCPKTVRNC